MTMTREAYRHELDLLRENIVTMASMVDKAIARAVDALRRGDARQAAEVVEGDQEINRQRWQIEEDAILVIATQAPMAGDLRQVISVVAIVAELERMADHATSIAKMAIQMADEPPLKKILDIPRMADLAREMLRDSITAFIAGDAEAAREIIGRDREVDLLFDQVYRELLTYMLADPATINRATRLLYAARNPERIADRVTNICERVVYVATGTMIEAASS